MYFNIVYTETVMAWRGMARHGRAGLGMAGRGKAWQGTWLGMAWQGLVWLGKMWLGWARLGNRASYKLGPIFFVQDYWVLPTKDRDFHPGYVSSGYQGVRRASEHNAEFFDHGKGKIAFAA